MNMPILSSQNTEWFRCPKCENSFMVRSDDPDRHLLKASGSMRCPNFKECGGRLVHRSFKKGPTLIKNARNVTALELYQAAAGVGLPEERKCSPKDLKKLMLGSRITAVHLEDHPDPKKSIVMSLTLDNGKTVYLTTSVKGATIYKVTDVR